MTTALKSVPCLLLCAGCVATPPAPPTPPLPPANPVTPPPGIHAQAVIAPVHYGIAAYFPPVPGSDSWQAFFSTSADLIHWQRLSNYPYPAAGAWITNAIFPTNTQGFFRAGISVP